MTRSTSLSDALAIMKKGMILWKIRNKGAGQGLKAYKRHYQIDMEELRIDYYPNKAITGFNCTAGGPGGKYCKKLYNYFLLDIHLIQLKS